MIITESSEHSDYNIPNTYLYKNSNLTLNVEYIE